LTIKFEYHRISNLIMSRNEFEFIFLVIIGFVMIPVILNSNNSLAITDSREDNMFNREISVSLSENFQDDNSMSDIFGIRKIYDTKPGGFEWYMNMDDPEEDPHLNNYGNIQENDNNSYNIGDRSRLSVYSEDGIDNDEGNMDTYDFPKLREKGYWHKPTDWKNVEITGEYHYRGGDGPGITHFVRSEDHSSLHDGCGGSSYKNKIYFNGTSNFNKEQAHPTSWEMPYIEHNYGDLKNHWFRFKTIVYNFPMGYVKLENWLDPYNDNNWIKIGQHVDKGAWGKDGTKCGGKSDEIITWGSPNVTFRWDDISVDFRNLSIREIEPPI
jgi:hypothetical protein